MHGDCAKRSSKKATPNILSMKRARIKKNTLTGGKNGASEFLATNSSHVIIFECNTFWALLLLLFFIVTRTIHTSALSADNQTKPYKSTSIPNFASILAFYYFVSVCDMWVLISFTSTHFKQLVCSLFGYCIYFVLLSFCQNIRHNTNFSWKRNRFHLMRIKSERVEKKVS